MISIKDLKVVLLVSFGNVLEYFDFFIYIYLSSFIAENCFSGSSFSKITYVYIIFATGCFLRPIGGILFGHFGDRYGRRKVFLITILIMSISSIGIGVIPSSTSIGDLAPVILIVMRVIQGIALGAESPGSLTYSYEYMNDDCRVFGVSFNLVSVFVGMGSGSLIIYLLSSFLTTHEMSLFGWRVPFLIGACAGIICFFARKKLKETREFNLVKKENKIEKVPIFKLLQSEKLKLLNGILLVVSLGIILNFFGAYLRNPKI